MQKYDRLGIIGEGAYGTVVKGKNKETGEVSLTTNKDSCYKTFYWN